MLSVLSLIFWYFESSIHLWHFSSKGYDYDAKLLCRGMDIEIVLMSTAFSKAEGLSLKQKGKCKDGQIDVSIL